MEWLEHKILSVAVGLAIAWHWYDKKSRDERFVKLEARMDNAEAAQSNQQTQIEVMRTELKAFSKLTDTKLEHIQDGMNKVLTMLDRREQYNNDKS